MVKGSCLCGGIRFKINGKLGANDACHCNQCRKWSGHYLATVEVQPSQLEIDGEEQIGWYYSSSKVRRGFCSKCGSALFFDPLDKDKHDWIGIAMGTVDAPTKMRLSRHIFVAEKGDYYEITDALPQHEY